MFAIEAVFDQKTEEEIYAYWQGLKETGLDDSMIRIPGNRPHISLGLFHGVERTMFIDAFREFAKGVKPMAVQFDSVGVFPTTNTVFLSPLPSQAFHQAHEKLYKALSEFAAKGDSYYKKEQWMPHCSLAISVSEEALLPVMENAIQRFQPIKGTIERIALIEVFVNENGIHHVEEVSLDKD